MGNYKTYAVLVALSCGLALVLTPLIRRLALRANVLDHPGTRKIHHRPIPLLGGLAIALAMWLPITALWLYDNRVAAFLRAREGMVLQILLSGLAMLLLGVYDDLRGLNARKKLMAQLPVALVLVISGVGFESITIPSLGSVPLGWAGPVLTLLWLVGITNAINLVDGIDGLASGVAFFAATTIAVISIYNDNVVGAVIMTALAGACLGFLPYNFNPARIFLGDTGSLFLGMTLAVSSLLTSQKGTLAASLLIPVLVLGFPVIDTLLAMVRRAVRGKSMFSGDAGHIHHRLLARGLSHRQASLIIYAFCLLCGLVALVTVMENSMGMAFGFAALFVVLFAGLRALGYWKALSQLGKSPERLQFKFLYHVAELAKCKLALANDVQQIPQILQMVCQEYQKPGFKISWPANGHHAAAEHLWLQPEISTVKDLPVETHEFSDTGMRLDFYLHHRDDQDELHLEKRNLLSSLAEAANQRLAALLKSLPPS
ncbi:MraY family glycosyltransferase [Fontisphaera persica]|uniref:glycosyltransferase family 4 protein n=1 Tax=Fontisphaera persica TaxID=2974023 RepID=UPI0024BFA7EC|nr:MraY family glycosyltransferase [Fontisphaera persica]WCJ59753.1 MraY family glycosyltransferase [Fontisphaera persica]